MEFKATDDYIKQQKRTALYLVLCFSAVVCYEIVQIVSVRSLDAAVWPLIILLVFVPWLFRLAGTLRDGAEGYPVLGFDSDLKSLYAKCKGQTVDYPLVDMDKLRLQYRSGRLESFLIVTKSGQQLTVTGYNNLEIIADILRNSVPAENITVAKWFHRS